MIEGSGPKNTNQEGRERKSLGQNSNKQNHDTKEFDVSCPWEDFVMEYKSCPS